jgi:hypothetical protein
MSLRTGIFLIAFVFIQLSVYGQNSSGGFFYVTLVVKDNITLEASERISQMRKPLKRTFYLKSEIVNYTLFNGNVAKLTADQILETLDSGFALYFDKQEHQGHKNIKPGIMEILAEDSEVDETIEDLSAVKESALRKKLVKGTKIRFSGFVVSVNEEKLGPIQMEISVIE